MMKKLLVTAVWGRTYFDTFLKFCLPSLLSPENLPSLKPYSENFFAICTTKDLWDYFLTTEAYKNVSEYAVPVFYPVEEHLNKKYDTTGNLTYAVMTAVHNGVMLEYQNDYAYVFVMPDTLWFDGALCNVLKPLNEGKRAVYAFGMHLDMGALEKYTANMTNGVIKISSEQTCSLTLKNLHGISESSLINSKNFIANGNFYISDEDRTTAVLKMAYLTPAVVYPYKKLIPVKPEQTIDNGSFVNDNIDDQNLISIISDSREFIMIAIDSQETKPWGAGSRGINYLDVAFYVSRYIADYAFDFYKHSCRIYTGQKTDGHEALQEKLESFMNKVRLVLKYKQFFYDWHEVQLEIIRKNDVGLHMKNIADLFSNLLNDDEIYSCLNIDRADAQRYLQKLLSAINDENIRYMDFFNTTRYIMNLFGSGEFFQSLLDEYRKGSELIDEFTEKSVPFYIFSAGDDTRMYLKMFGLSNKNVMAIIDDNPKYEGTTLNGIPVIKTPQNPENLNDAENIIIISTKFGSVIYNKLMELGYEKAGFHLHIIRRHV